jgi:hypothetical protein
VSTTTRTYPKILRNRERRIERRLDPDRAWSDQSEPMLGASNIHYEMADKTRAINCGGIGAVHLLVTKLGLAREIDARVKVLKRHLPYHESDHVLNLAYNVLVGGQRLEDIELRRNDEAFMDGLGAQRIPDPTTAGDFTRRFGPANIEALLEAIDQTRLRVWRQQPAGFMKEAIIQIDGTIAPTGGQCKDGIGLSYKGIWGYHPLIVTLSNTNEVLALVNRPGNVASHQDCVPWINRAIARVRQQAETVILCGDTDFSLTGEFDGWHDQGVKFVFGFDANPKVVGLAEALPESAWQSLQRLPRYEIATVARGKRARIKEQIVRAKGYQNQVLTGESLAQIEYQPGKCQRPYRLVILRKNISVQRGEQVLFDEIRYFFYLTNLDAQRFDAPAVVALANDRCNQENVIAQLKGGVNAMRMPVDDLMSNWAYMVMTALAWNLKAWFGLLLPNRSRGMELVKMEFRRFLQALILLPTQIVRSGRRIIYRIQSFNAWVGDLFSIWEKLRRAAPA